MEAARGALRKALGVESNIFLTSSGTAALVLALDSIRRDVEDEVIVPTFACPSIVESVIVAGMRPVLCDVAEDGVADIAEIASRFGPKTRAVIAAHVLGAAVDVALLEKLCLEAGIVLIDDAAQAFGGMFDARALGTFGAFGILSFGRHKPVYAGGGGALVVNDPRCVAGIERALPRLDAPSRVKRRAFQTYAIDRVAALMKLARGGTQWFEDVAHSIDAYALAPLAGMDLFTATLVASEVEHLNERRRRVRAHTALYDALLIEATDVRPMAPRREGATTVRAVFVPEGRRHALAAFLARRGVETMWLYYPLHRVARYARFASGSYLVAESLWTRILCLPCRGEHETAAIKHVAQSVRTFFGADE